MGFAHRSRSPAQTTNERTYDVLPKPDIFQSYRHDTVPARGATSAFFKHFGFMLVDREGWEIPCVH